MKRGALALEDGDWDAANGFYEQVLNENVEESRAYFGMVLAYYNVSTEDELYNGYYDYTQNNHFKKAQRFANSDMKEKLDQFIKANNERVEGLKQYGHKLEEQYEDLYSRIESLKQQRTSYTPPAYEFDDRIAELERNEKEALLIDKDLDKQYSTIKEEMAQLNSKKESLSIFQSKTKKEIEIQIQECKRKLELVHKEKSQRNSNRTNELTQLKQKKKFIP